MSAEPKIFPDHPPLPADTPEAGYEIIDERFRKLIREEAEIKRLWRGAEWSEGVVYLPHQQVVVWSDIPNNRMLQYDPASGETTVFREPSNYTNGNCIDLQGRLVTATHLTHCISRTESNGDVTVLVDRYEGRRLNSPNDVVVKSDGSIWFTDPPYGILSSREGVQRDSEQKGNFVYRFDPERNRMTAVIDSLDRPNGLAFSPDESRLYVSDTGSLSRMYVFDVEETGRTLHNKRVFVSLSPGVSDGFQCDIHGNVWTSAGDGIHCYTPSGKILGKIKIPELRCANCCFGGPDRDMLYIAGDTSLYSVQLAVSGAYPH